MTPAGFIKKWGDRPAARTPGLRTSTSSISATSWASPRPPRRSRSGNAIVRTVGLRRSAAAERLGRCLARPLLRLEYKGKHKDLNAALRQLQAYALTCATRPIWSFPTWSGIIVHTKLDEHDFAQIRVHPRGPAGAATSNCCATCSGDRRSYGPASVRRNLPARSPSNSAKLGRGFTAQTRSSRGGAFFSTGWSSACFR